MKKILKWREQNISPSEIKFKKIKLIKEISYPHCGNDVTECLCLYKDKKTNLFIKTERGNFASFQTEVDHLNILHKEKYYLKTPKIIEDGYIKDRKYIVLTKVDGERLSDILKKDSSDKTDYLDMYGKELAVIHGILPDKFEIAKQRSINDIPREEKYIAEKDIDILSYIKYLKENKPDISFDTFIHGDFHYGNIHWKNKNINGVLDWEYSGKGFKEQDIAWAIIVRSNQTFMDNFKDIDDFLNGYKKVGSYNNSYLKWCLINGYCHFYFMNKDNDEYKDKIKELLNESINHVF